MPALSLLIKPASGNCNMRCGYCFYYDVAKNRLYTSYGIMNQEVMQVLVKKSLQQAEGQITFAFQGGEPTLAGLEFFQQMVEVINRQMVEIINTNTENETKTAITKLKIDYALQTNGINIDEKWADFLAKNNFLVGLSLDGTSDIHDLNRKDASQKGTWSRVMKTVDIFRQHKVEFNILCVVSSVVARHIEKVYQFFSKNKFEYLQFIPCLDPLNEQPGLHLYSLSPQRYATFLKKLFDLWYKDIRQGNIISIRFFDNLVQMLMGYHPEACGMLGTCQCQFVIEADGSVYPCDFYVLDEWKLGNILDMDFNGLFESLVAQNFIFSSRYTDPECTGCRWSSLCRGGCRRDREPFIDGRPVLNHYCSSFKEFYSYAYQRLTELANMFKEQIH